MTRISIVIPTLGRPALLRRVLERLDAQTARAGDFEAVVVADAKETAHDELEAAVGQASFPARLLRAERPGASAARNTGWRQARSPLILFLDDDVLPEPPLVAEHLAWHDRNPDEAIGVLGHVRWADELEVTPFMRWLEHGIQFDYPGIVGTDAGWGRFYTANASVKRAAVERAGGFEEERLPFGYEDLDLALRMHEGEGFTLLYNRAAVAEHLHPMDLAFWRRRVARIAVSERQFAAMHPDFVPYFHGLFSRAAAARPALRISTRVVRFVPRGLPVAGRLAWGSANGVWLQELAGPFLAAWEAAGDQRGSGPK